MRDFTLSHHNHEKLKYHAPPSRAYSCGSQYWMPCGLKDAPLTMNELDQAAGRNRQTTLTGEKLIASASEWTSSNDKMSMAARVSKLG